MIQLSPYAKGKTTGNRTDLSILLLITHLDFEIACNHSNDCLSEHRFKGFPHISLTKDPCSTSFVGRDKLIETCDAFVD